MAADAVSANQNIGLRPADPPANPPRRADGSFEKYLESAENDLARKKSLPLLTPWPEIERLFNISKLEFDFSLGKSDQDSPREKPSFPASRIETSSIENDSAEKPDSAPVIEFKNTETLKEILSKNLPPPQLQFLPVGFIFQPEAVSPQNPSKPNLELLISEIVKIAKLIKAGQKTELSLSLSQKDLGELFVSFILKNGQLLINIAANAETKKLMEQNIDELKTALKRSNIGLDSLRITEVEHGKSGQFSG